MMRALFAGVSGIRNHQTWLDVIGNNIANVNTIGFKNSRATFSEILTQTLRSATGPGSNYGGTNPMQVGLGTQLASIDVQFQQGAFESTGSYTDLAIQGNGFFVLSDGSQTYFTRSGAFNIDAEGYLTAQGGSLKVQGYMADQMGVISNNLTPNDIQIPFGMKTQANATSEIEFYCNLDAEMTDSDATLVSSGTTGVSQVLGQALNGAGGTHSIVISGANATQGIGTGANTWSGGDMALDTELGADGLGITDLTNFVITVDGGTATTIEGLVETSTVENLINAINDQVSGVTASWDSGAGEVVLTRNYYGSNTSVTMTGEINDVVFGAWTWQDGDASTLTAVDTFTPSYGGSAIVTNLTLEADETSGLITNITDIGGGGVTVTAADGLAAGTLVVDTDETVHTTSIVTYDSLGGEHILNLSFTKTANENNWMWNIDVDDPGQVISGNTGTVTFNNDGSLATFAYDGGVSAFTFNPNNGAGSSISIDLDAGTIGGIDGITQFVSPTTTILQSQDGYGMGELANIFIDENGTIKGTFTNDQILDLAQIVLANFNNPQGLNREGGNLYRLSANTGDAIYGLPQTNFGSAIYSGYVEMSNVDLSKQFADMIVAQRGFQASARVITTADRMLEEITRLKRM